MGSSEIKGIRPRIVLFGDSITEQSFRSGGWGASLADTYSRKADIIIRGYGGYNTRWALHLLDHIFPSNDLASPVAVTIFFGANDAALLGRNSHYQHVPLNEYKENLRLIIHHLKKCSPTMVVVLITPPPVDEDGRMEYARSLYGAEAMKLPERTNEMTGFYAKECIDLAEELQVPCINLWAHMQETDGWQKKFLSDGLHLTEEGNRVVYREVIRAFYDAGLKADIMPYDFPHHSVLLETNPEQAFKSEDLLGSRKGCPIDLKQLKEESTEIKHTPPTAYKYDGGRILSWLATGDSDTRPLLS